MYWQTVYLFDDAQEDVRTISTILYERTERSQLKVLQTNILLQSVLHGSSTQ